MNRVFASIFERDLQRLSAEVTAFSEEANIWKVTAGVSNSAGNLTLHLLGNLNHFIGDTIGHNGYVRNRDMEFTASGIPRQQLLAEIEQLRAVVGPVLTGLSTEQFGAEFPLDFLGRHTVAYYLTHFYGHLNYHLGQINYLRRMLEG